MPDNLGSLSITRILLRRYLSFQAIFARDPAVQALRGQRNEFDRHDVPP
ncbi:hypothetical protein [Deinococcus humi]|uniref:Uncharacterized protein n=1 Tax=Deinococcus humi TaxID=662880 RepID=A0A7W8K229_9DEIO|nr:hypothetical protein [Deinococcus humi]MBB5366086.1 hypothetical protein [Deinococcus humi]